MASRMERIGIDLPTAFGPKLVDHGQLQDARSETQGCRGAVGQTLAIDLVKLDPIDHDLQVLNLLGRNLEVLVDLMGLAIDPNPCVTTPEQILQKGFDRLVGMWGDGGQEQAPLGQRRVLPSLVLFQHPSVEDLIDRLGFDGGIALRAMLFAHPRKEHPEVIVDFGDRADRRARGMR